jgi:hypothetical protein
MNTQSHGRPLDANYWRQGWHAICIVICVTLPRHFMAARPHRAHCLRFLGTRGMCLVSPALRHVRPPSPTVAEA